MIDIVNLTLTEVLLYSVGQLTILIDKNNYLFIVIKLLYYTDYFTILVLYFIDILL